MTNIPDWLKPFKIKGHYTKKTKTGYALYRGHSERVPGKNYPVFKCDEYLGIVTEKDGLIPSTPPVKPNIRVVRYGLFCIAKTPCCMLGNYLQSKGLDRKLIYTHSLLSLEGSVTQISYEGSWLSVKYPELDLSASITSEESVAIERMKVQMMSKLRSVYREDLDRILALAENIYAVYVNGSWHVSVIGEELKSLSELYQIDFTIK